MIKFELESLFRSDLDHKILSYLKAIGKPDRIVYGTKASHHTATLIYGKEEPKTPLSKGPKHIDINL
jgi:hypothetical protein